MKHALLYVLFFFSLPAYAGILKGKISDEKGEALSFASIYIKGTTKGTTTNNDGYYKLDVSAGTYTFVVQYVGYQRLEFEFNVGEGEVQKNITMKAVNTSLKELVVKANENLALKIMKKAIKKRTFYNKQVEQYKAEVYVKTVIKLDDTPDSNSTMVRLFVSDNDTSSKKELEQQKGIQYLAETVNELYVKQPNKRKINIKSSRISGNKGGYGLSTPLDINMYDNSVNVGDNLTPRGIVSPIADGAPLSYNYEMLGSYLENKKLIYRIKVSPKRKFEPLFDGVVDIVDDEYRIHAVDFVLSKDQGLEMFDTLKLKQLFVPVNNYFLVKDQSLKFKLKIMGFKLSGNLVNVFNNYAFDFDAKEIFDKYAREYAADALDKNASQWDTLRPLALDQEETENYRKKDSIAALPPVPDSNANKNSLRGIIFGGFHKQKDSLSFSTSPFLNLYNLNWNTVEGPNYKFYLALKKTYSKYTSLNNALVMRYGISNEQFNAYYKGTLRFGKTNRQLLRISGGRYVYQYNNQEPVNELINSLYTVFYGQNYYKNYQAWFGKMEYKRRYVRGLDLHASASYQQRQALANTNWFTFRKKQSELTENYPSEIMTGFFPQHEALQAGLKIAYQPGQKLVKYPDRVCSVGSIWPTFYVAFSAGLPVLGSDVDYSKWQVGMSDDMELNLWGDFSYAVQLGGFLHNTKSYLPDYTHFNGGQIILASPYLNSFQLSPYYLNSNTQSFYASVHAEHHFQGLLTNKIPLFRNLRYYLVAASNAYYVNENNNYIEASLGLENLGFRFYRFLRVDGVVGYTNFKKPVYGIRIGFSGMGISIGGSNNSEDY